MDEEWIRRIGIFVFVTGYILSVWMCGIEIKRKSWHWAVWHAGSALLMLAVAMVWRFS